MCDFMVSIINSERHSNYVYNELNEFPRYNKPTFSICKKWEMLQCKKFCLIHSISPNQNKCKGRMQKPLHGQNPIFLQPHQ